MDDRREVYHFYCIDLYDTKGIAPNINEMN